MITAYTEIQHFALLDHDVNGIHDLLDRSRPVMPMKVENVDIISLKLCKRVTKGEVKTLLVVSRVVGAVATRSDLVAHVLRRELGWI